MDKADIKKLNKITKRDMVGMIVEMYENIQTLSNYMCCPCCLEKAKHPTDRILLCHKAHSNLYDAVLKITKKRPEEMKLILDECNINMDIEKLLEDNKDNE
jgi:trimethylamine:corrinoid methyltransferase-like protein